MSTDEVVPGCSRCLELEQLCDATYVARGADAHAHACSELARWQAARGAVGKYPGCEGSLCDGLASLFEYIEKLEANKVPASEPLPSPKSENLAFCAGVVEGERLAIEDAVSLFSKDTARLDWLNKNFFNREKDKFDAQRYPEFHQWVFFAPKGVQGDVRLVLDQAMQGPAGTAFL